MHELNDEVNKENVALFIDHENIFLAWKKHPSNTDKSRYNYDSLLDTARKKGQLAVAYIYLGSDRKSSANLYELFKRGITAVYTPLYGGGENGKSLGDPMMICDIMQTLYERPLIKTFVIVTGDKDFIPVIRKINEHGKRVIIIGTEHATAQVLIDECTRLGSKFEAYETLHREFERDEPDFDKSEPQLPK